MSIHVVATEVKTGESDEVTVTNDYVLICDGRRYLADTLVEPDGTHVLTIKQRPA